MTVKEYLMQGYRLNNRIKIHQEEIERLRELSYSCKSPGLEPHYNPNKNTKSPFESLLLEAFDMEEELAEMLKVMILFKREMLELISSIPNMDEQLVIHYRYIDNLSFQQIGEKLYVDRHTVKRWHDRALAKMHLPPNPTVIDKHLLKR